ncbi:nuclear transcription factor Y subunit B-5-like [Humulus lupulus]|uniref:nuclear transcription factor Y subunit B-5-like n=1 Tax=Humulus lupulus TaxID=3486 RepID=UPI002B40459E|nr:nuclear transcription factor Y subunit B-5-like [Humulus lupulus]
MFDNLGNNREREGFHYNNCSSGPSSSHEIDQDGFIKEQDRLLPIANVGRIMKQILPPNAKISKEAKETMQECVSEFISFVTGEASDKCHKEKRKTVNGDDICWALAALGFDDYADPLKRYLHKFRELEGERSSAHGGQTSNSNNKGSGSNNSNNTSNNHNLDQNHHHHHHHHHHHSQNNDIINSNYIGGCGDRS